MSNDNIKNKNNHSEYAFLDVDFMQKNETRPIRLQIELQKPEQILTEKKINEAIVFFGSARAISITDANKKHNDALAAIDKNPDDSNLKKQLTNAKLVLANSKFLQEATNLASIISKDESRNFVVFTGGGPGFMEAATKGAYEANKPSVALNIKSPNEQKPNPYVTPELSFTFHYFAIRKMHLLMRSKALIVFPGGFGTFDELFETLTLLQTKKIAKIPVILFHKKFWQRIINFPGLVDEGFITQEELEHITFVDKAEEAWDIIKDYYPIINK